MIDIEHDNVKAAIKAFILAEFLPGDSPEDLTDTTPLLTTGILDSIAILQLVDFLESHFEISIPPHEMDVDHLDSVAAVVQLVRAKRRDAAAR
jgi:acyl carrier protein